VTGDEFSDFAPYVASVNDAGIVAFQAALRGGGMGVFTGTGGEVAEVVGPDRVAEVTSHPDLNAAGAVAFYGGRSEGGQAVFLYEAGRLQTIAETGDRFELVGPLGPTMNEAGTVAFRADPRAGVNGVFAGDAAAAATMADTDGPWSGFHGLPVITGDGTVVFRADKNDGAEGIYAARAGAVRAIVQTGKLFQTLAEFPSANGAGTVAFAASLRSGGEAIFIVDEGGVRPVVDPHVFESCRSALVNDAGSVVYVATPPGGSLGLFVGPDRESDRVVAVGDSLLGSTVEELAANPVSVNAAGQIAVRVRLADSGQAILRADPLA
jgi:hypothetical protein